MGTKKKAFHYALHIGLGYFIVGWCLFEMIWVKEDLYIHLELTPDSVYLSISACMFWIACVLGILASPKYSVSKGRRSLFLATSFLMTFASILSVIPNTVVVCLGRFAKGLASGMFLVTCPVYIEEVSPEKLKKRLVGLVYAELTLGALIVSIFSLCLSTSDGNKELIEGLWKLVVVFPIFANFYNFHRFQKKYKLDTPYWYLTQGKLEECAQALDIIYKEEKIQEKLNELEISTVNLLETQGKPAFFTLFFNKKQRKMLRISMLLPLFNSAPGLSLLLNDWIISAQDFFSNEIKFRAATCFLLLIQFALACFLLKYKKPHHLNLLLSGQVIFSFLLMVLCVFSSIIRVSDQFYVLFLGLCISVYSPLLGLNFWIIIKKSLDEYAFSLSVLVYSLVVIFFSMIFEEIHENNLSWIAYMCTAIISFLGSVYICFEFKR